MPLSDADRPHFAQLLAAVSAVYARDLSPDVVAIYWAALAEFDLAAVRQAMDRHVKNPDSGQFMPKPADLIRMLKGGTQDSAMVAWSVVEWAIRHVGGYEDVVFDDALTMKCIELVGGWIKVCATTEDELPFKAKEFQAFYRGFAMRREVPTPPERLIGRANAHNAAQGLPMNAPLMIGRTMRGEVKKISAQEMHLPVIAAQPEHA
jgi:hypothetical protein